MNTDNNPYKELQPGTTLSGGKYTIVSKLGEGGFGITYKAVQNGLNRTVCIKEYFLAGKCVRQTQARTLYIPDNDTDFFEKYRASFVKEAKLLATLRHPNIVEVIDVFDENNTSYMVMDFIEGESLQSIVEKTGPVSYPLAVNYIGQIANAVGYIHEHNVLHRDIKPDNIMITADYRAILIDFGSAREFEQDKTQMHTSILTHGYAPTEQYSHNSRKGSYTDIYALGATMYFIVTGEVPVDAAARTIEKLPEPKSITPDLPDEANRTILKAMQIKAENRHQTIREFMDDLRNVKPSTLIDETLGGGGGRNFPPENKVGKDKSNRKKILWIALGLGAAVVAAILILMPWSESGSADEPNKISQNGVAPLDTVETSDFTGMDIYPMVYVEGGTFSMGNNELNDKEKDCPEHEVELDGFYIGQFEVSQKLWEEIMGNNPSDYKGEALDSLPVENVSIKMVDEFVKKLNARTGQDFSLPTEAQWEFAARGGNKSEGFTYSGTNDPKQIWFRESSSQNIKNGVANELGIYQMSGNVAELCLDRYNRNFYKNSEKHNPISKTGEQRVVRGGSFLDENKFCRVSLRDAYEDSLLPKTFIGLRLVLNKPKK